jgi:hypothetical protein
MLKDLLGSVASADAYRRFAAQKASRTALYVSFLSLLFTVGGTIALKLRVGPAVDETFQWLETSVPKLTFSGGKVESDPPGPARLVHPRAPEVAIMIDTSRTEPVTAQVLQENKVLAFLSNNALAIEQQSGRVETYDLSKASTKQAVVVDSRFFREAAGALKSVVYPATVLTVFVLAAAWTALAGLFYAVVGLLLNSALSGGLGFGSLYQLAIHAQTAAVLLRIVLAYLPFQVPFAGVLTMTLTGVYLWLGVRANARAADAPLEA